MVKIYKDNMEFFSWRSTKRMAIILPLFGIFAFFASGHGFDDVFTKDTLIYLGIYIFIMIFNWVTGVIMRKWELAEPDQLRIVDEKYLQIGHKNKPFPIADIYELYASTRKDRADNVMVVRQLPDDKELKDEIYGTAGGYEMPVIREFLQDITHINPSIKLDETLFDWRDNPEAKFPGV